MLASLISGLLMSQFTLDRPASRKHGISTTSMMAAADLQHAVWYSKGWYHCCLPLPFSGTRSPGRCMHVSECTD